MDVEHPLVRAAATLLSVCDGAQQHDERGYNAPDSAAVRKLFGKYALSHDDLVWLHGTLRKYQRQLSGFGIDYATLAVPSDAHVATHPEPHASAFMVTMTFGKYKGHSLGALATDQQPGGRSWLRWFAETANGSDTWKALIRSALTGEPCVVPVAPAPVPARSPAPTVVQATFVYVVGADTVAVSFPYNPTVVAALKTGVDGRKWNPQERRWEAPATQVVKLVEVFGGLDTVELSPEARTLYDAEVARRLALDTTRVKQDSTLSFDGMLLQPYPYQKVGVEFVEHAGGRAMIADEMGLGKTIQALAYAVRNHRKTLVVCPAAVKINWQREIAKFAGLDACMWDGKGYKGTLDAQFHVVNYDNVWKHQHTFNSMGFQLLVPDEAHLLKTHTSKRAQAIMGAAKKEDLATYPGLNMPEAILLTGTPILNRPAEAFVLLNFLSPQRFSSFFQFANRYGAWKPNNGWGAQRPSVPQNLDHLHDRCKDLVIRRLKKDVLTELPPKQVGEVYVELSDTDRKAYTGMLRALFREWSSTRKIGVVEMAPIVEFLNERKLPKLWEMIDELVEGGRSVLVFSTRLAPLYKTREHYGTKAALIDGAMSLKARQAEVDRIQDGSAQVACLSIRAAGVGLTMTKADTVIFIDQDWVPANHLQAEDRAHRIGQLNPVQVYYLIAEHTTDELMRDVLRKKQDVAEQIADGAIQVQRRVKSAFKDFVRRLKRDFKELDELDDSLVSESEGE